VEIQIRPTTNTDGMKDHARGWCRLCDGMVKGMDNWAKGHDGLFKRKIIITANGKDNAIGFI
jgi:hypothetical protein